MSVLPLSWLISVWKNFPEFWTSGNIWNHGTQEVNAEFGYFDKVPIPRGPYSCDRHCQRPCEREFSLHGLHNNNIANTVSSRSKFAYLTKSSFHNPAAIRSSLTSLYSSRSMPSSVEEVLRRAVVKKENTDIIYVKEFPRSPSHQVQADLPPGRLAGLPLLLPAVTTSDPTAGGAI